MGFKVDSSFLRFLTMGARGVHRVSDELRSFGFEPIELERYCGSNKIWATKVKRLRLPDLLCVKTGLRLEVRAKSDLKIRPIWHQKEDRVLAHIFVCFLAYVLCKTLGQMCQQAGLGSEPRRVLDELGELRN